MNGFEKMEMQQAFDAMNQIIEPITTAQKEYFDNCIEKGFTEEQAFESSKAYISELFKMMTGR